MSDERHEGQREFDLLDRVDLLIATLPPGDALRRELLDLRMEIAEQEETVTEARQMIEKLEEVVKKVTSPANRIGTYLSNPAKDTAHIVVGGADYYCNVDPRIPPAKLKKGTRVLVNEAYVIVGDLGFETAGPVTKITEVIGEDRLRVGTEHGSQSLVLQRSPQLTKTMLKAGDEVRVDPNYRVALELLSRPPSREHYLDDVPELPWSKVGGQDGAGGDQGCDRAATVAPELFRNFSTRRRKVFSSTARLVRQNADRKSDRLQFDQTAPGEIGRKDERNISCTSKVRRFSICGSANPNGSCARFFRPRARNGGKVSPFLFIDEAESILGTRRASRYSNILSTLVPMFCSEMDGSIRYTTS